MLELLNEDLGKYTTIKIGGTAKRMLIPETTAELVEIINEQSPKYFLGGGSNLLINNREFDLVINLRNFDNSISSLGDGMYVVGASVRLQSLIKRINNDGYGGIEYLCNVPGLIGGAIAMNAGTGKNEGKSISDYIQSIKVVKNGAMISLNKDEAHFEFRNSLFKGNSEYVIVSCVFYFPAMSHDESSIAREEKMRYYKTIQDPSYPNFGSVFFSYNGRIMNFVKKVGLGGKVHFSKKTTNWILNEKNGKYKDAIDTIKKVEFMHKITHKQCVREVVVWE